MINNRPLLSVVIPTYARPKLLADCLRSISFQVQFNQYEIIVTDNDSPNQQEITEVIAYFRQVFAERNIHIEYYKQPNNVGVVPNKKSGVKRARGKYVLISDDDDFFTDPHFFNDAITMLEATPGIASAVFAVRKAFDDGDPKFFERCMTEFDSGDPEVRRVSGMTYFSGFWTKFGPRQCNATITRKRALEQAHWYDCQCNDQSFHLLPALVGDILVSERCVGIYRKHCGQQGHINQTAAAKPELCAESQSAIDQWLHEYRRSRKDPASTRAAVRFWPLLWRLKSDILKEEGPIMWLYAQGPDSMRGYLENIKRRGWLDYCVINYFSIRKLHLERLDPSIEKTKLWWLRYRARRAVGIAILHLDRLVH